MIKEKGISVIESAVDELERLGKRKEPSLPLLPVSGGGSTGAFKDDTEMGKYPVFF